ncbi:hypothetical protein [Peristeroidobacter soli]|jgi:hypothetical protein|uniref:hypothetical protein n=1 Tax=Peristeroidobacter soli TaxID=2497877 RepID=UPI00101D373B|nr:hypothetical protein [Peristeroidobacter soli]
MRVAITRTQIATAVAAVLSAATMAPALAKDSGKPAVEVGPRAEGVYATGDFHNHTTCSDGSISMQKLIKKVTDTQDTPWGLDWFVQAGHGGNGNRNCTLVEDASLSSEPYPFVEGRGPTTTWANSIGAAAVKGNTGSSDGSSSTPLSSQASPSMWRWQSLQELQYPVAEYLSGQKGLPVFVGMESVVAGHEHTSMSVVSGQVVGKNGVVGPGSYVPVGDANALAQWSYCFDRGDTDNSRGGANNWDCSVPGIDYSTNPDWKANAAKLFPAGGVGSGVRGHNKTVDALKWMASYHPYTSYYVPAHLERAGPFNPDGNNGFNIEHLRNFNNAAPKVAFGFESQPGHGASDNRGEYSPDRNSIGGVRVDSVGGTTWGGTGVYAGQVGGVWDALLGEGRNWWFFASSDWHNRGSFSADDRRSTQDFYPGEYQRDYVMVRKTSRDKGGPANPQEIVDGLRSGNSFAASGQLIDRLAFVACSDNRFKGDAGAAELEAIALQAAKNGTEVNINANCAVMGEKLKINNNDDVLVTVVVRDPSGTNYSPYTFPNPSLLQISKTQPLNKPELDHFDVISGLVTGMIKPSLANYSGQWPDNWVDNPDMNTVPAGAKNTSAGVVKTFGNGTWTTDGDYKVASFRLSGVKATQYLRLRGSNLPASVPYETDADGNPLADIYTNASDASKLRIPCTTQMTTQIPANTVYTGTSIDGCPAHLARFPAVTGQQYVSYDVAAWSDLWFYSNPIFIEVKNGTIVANVK